MITETRTGQDYSRILVVAGPRTASAVLRSVIDMQLPNCRVHGVVNQDEALSAFLDSQPDIIMVWSRSYPDRGRRIFDAIFKMCCADKVLKLPRFLFCREEAQMRELTGIVADPKAPVSSYEVMAF